jgi:hypothetical protein
MRITGAENVKNNRDGFACYLGPRRIRQGWGCRIKSVFVGVKGAGKPKVLFPYYWRLPVITQKELINAYFMVESRQACISIIERLFDALFAADSRYACSSAFSCIKNNFLSLRDKSPYLLTQPSEQFCHLFLTIPDNLQCNPSINISAYASAFSIS